MSAFAFFGALELGLLYGLVALGVYLTFRVLDFPDLSVDGSFPMGAAVAATAIVAGINPWVATGLAILAGAATGWVTAFLSVRCGILHLLASILTMIAAFSINIRIMGRPNLALLGEDTILTPFEALGDPVLIRPLVVAVLVVISALLVIRLLNSDFGLGLRAQVSTLVWWQPKGQAPRFTRISVWLCLMVLSVLQGLYLRKPTVLRMSLLALVQLWWGLLRLF